MPFNEELKMKRFYYVTVASGRRSEFLAHTSKEAKKEYFKRLKNDTTFADKFGKHVNPIFMCCDIKHEDGKRIEVRKEVELNYIIPN